MNRKNIFLKTLPLNLTLLGASTTAYTSEKPNIIFFLADDMGLGDIKIYDKTSTIPTPNMDRLATQGIRFMDAHSPASICTPSRYSILTGRYAFRRNTGLVHSAYDPPLLDNKHETVASMLKRVGYTTAAFGKWHLGMNFSNKKSTGPARPGAGCSHFSTKDVDFTKPISDGPLNHGFDYFFGLGSAINHGPYTFIENDHVVKVPTKFRRQKGYRKAGGPFREGWIADGWDDTQQGNVICNKALSFIRKHVEKSPDQPFFIYYASTANHFPWVPPDSFNGKKIKGAGGNDDKQPCRCDMIVENDIQLGEFMALLDDPNQDGDTSDSIADNTLVIVTSDNGADRGYYALIRDKKGSIYEGGHRVPLIVRWSGKIKKNQVSWKMVNLIDLYSTLADLTGCKPAPGAAPDSADILPALLGNATESWKRGIVIQNERGTSYSNTAIRDGEWKLIIKKHKPVELYNLKDDLKESENLISSNPEIVKKLMKEYKAISSSGK